MAKKNKGEKVKTPRKKPAKKPQLKEVGFNYEHGETRTRTIDVPGYVPFDITFTIPGSEYVVMFGMLSAGGKNRKENLGRAILKSCEAYLLGWTLPNEPDYKALVALTDEDVLLAIFNTIASAGEQAKN